MKITAFFICIITCIVLFVLSCDLEGDKPGEPTPEPASTLEPTPEPEATPEPTLVGTETPDASLPDPVITPDTTETELFIGQVITLTVSGSGADVTYHWSVFGNGNLDVETGETVTYTAPDATGMDWITCYATNSSDEFSEIVAVNFPIFGLDDGMLWLDANDSDSILDYSGDTIENGEGISEWQDKSGNENHANVAGGYPLYYTDAINGNPVVEFYRGTDPNPYLNIPNINGSLNFSRITFFIVARQIATTDITNQALFAMDNGNPNQGFELIANTDNSVFSFSLKDTANSISFPSPLISDPAIITGLYEPGTGRFSVWINGALCNFRLDYLEDMVCVNNLFIGGNYADISDESVDYGSFYGYIGEVVFYNKAISDNQVSLITNMGVCT